MYFHSSLNIWSTELRCDATLCKNFCAPRNPPDEVGTTKNDGGQYSQDWIARAVSEGQLEATHDGTFASHTHSSSAARITNHKPHLLSNSCNSSIGTGSRCCKWEIRLLMQPPAKEIPPPRSHFASPSARAAGILVLSTSMKPNTTTSPYHPRRLCQDITSAILPNAVHT